MGIQPFLALENLVASCSIIASGASGAKGRRNKRPGLADEVRALVELKKGETVYLAVGQMGESFCERNGVVSFL